jgi:hypothetical protein
LFEEWLARIERDFRAGDVWAVLEGRYAIQVSRKPVPPWLMHALVLVMQWLASTQQTRKSTQLASLRVRTEDCRRWEAVRDLRVASPKPNIRAACAEAAKSRAGQNVDGNVVEKRPLSRHGSRA